jgi:multidrug efflux system membrane fusion protein
LSYTQIKAPIKGRLGLRKVDPGNLITSSNTDGLVTITQMNPIDVLFKLPEADLPAVLNALRANKKLVVEAWNRAGAERLASGTLRAVDNQIDTTTGTVSLKAEFINDAAGNDSVGLFPNQFVNVRLRVGTLNNAVVLPTAAVQHGSLGTFVYVVRPALAPVDKDKEKEADEKPIPRATVRKVDLGPSNGMHTAITRGLEAGERVVIEGLDGLREGTEVVIIEEKVSTVGLRAPAAVSVGV